MLPYPNGKAYVVYRKLHARLFQDFFYIHCWQFFACLLFALFKRIVYQVPERISKRAVLFAYIPAHIYLNIHFKSCISHEQA